MTIYPLVTAMAVLSTAAGCLAVFDLSAWEFGRLILHAICWLTISGLAGLWLGTGIQSRFKGQLSPNVYWANFAVLVFLGTVGIWSLGLFIYSQRWAARLSRWVNAASEFKPRWASESAVDYLILPLYLVLAVLISSKVAGLMKVAAVQTKLTSDVQPIDFSEHPRLITVLLTREYHRFRRQGWSQLRSLPDLPVLLILLPVVGLVFPGGESASRLFALWFGLYAIFRISIFQSAQVTSDRGMLLLIKRSRARVADYLVSRALPLMQVGGITGVLCLVLSLQWRYVSFWEDLGLLLLASAYVTVTTLGISCRFANFSAEPYGVRSAALPLWILLYLLLTFWLIGSRIGPIQSTALSVVLHLILAGAALYWIRSGARHLEEVEL